MTPIAKKRQFNPAVTETVRLTELLSFQPITDLPSSTFLSRNKIPWTIWEKNRKTTRPFK